MSNYIVEDEMEDYGYYEMTPKDNNKFMLIVGIAILIVFIIIIMAFPKEKNTFSSIEEKMVEVASEYVYENNIQSDNEVYFDVSKLNINLPNSCSLLSGVIYNDGGFTPYLLCQDYESKVIFNEESAYQLKGHDIVFLLKGMDYIELGYTGNEMSISGYVKSDVGVYDIYYISRDSHVLMRKVIVLDNPDLYNNYPRINITSDDPMIIEKDTILPTATAVDNIDGDLSNSIVSYSDVDLSTLGEYRIIYNVRNSMGYETSLVRTVIVTDDVNNYNNFQIKVSLSTENMTNENVLANINVIGDGYDHTVLPNGEITNLPSFVYEFSENGEYEFVAVSKLGVENRKKVTIDNIDRDIPEGTCKAMLYSNKTVVNVNMSSFNYIVGYNYYFNGKESGYNKNSNYTINEATSEVKVGVRDYIGNETVITCSSQKGDPTAGNNNVKYYVYNNEEYVIANTRNDLTVFEKSVCNKIAQNSDVGNCGSACLSFALYYAAYLQRGNLSNMNVYNACHYNYGGVAQFTTISNPTKRDALNYIYDEINRGKVLSLQVTGTLARSSRHFVTVVGYKRSVYKGEYLQEEDLLVIDSWNGCFKTLSYMDTSKRTMYDNKDGKGYRLDVIKN